MKLYMFRTVRLSIIRSLFTVHSAMVYVIQVCRQLLSRSICSCSTAVYEPVWHIPLLSVQWINSWWWTDELSETCRVSCQNKFVKLVHLVGFIVNKFTQWVTKTDCNLLWLLLDGNSLENGIGMSRSQRAPHNTWRTQSKVAKAIFCVLCCWTIV